MFGYIAPRMDLLTESQKDRYRSFYCGLCSALGNLSGNSGKLLLSHDMTFLAILLQSLTDEECTDGKSRCVLHPIRERTMAHCRSIEYSAAMNLILFHFKLQDQIRDGGSGLSGAGERMLRPALERTARQYEVQFRTIDRVLNDLWKEEQQKEPDPDRLCNLSGEMLGVAFTPEWMDPYWKETVYRLGCGLGRFVYWMDAWDDQETDRRKRNYNPLVCNRYSTETEAFAKEAMEMLIGEACSYFELLPLEKDLDLLRNVLYSGVWQKYDLKRRNLKKERPQKNAE